MSPLIRKDRVWPTIIIAVLVIDVAVGFFMMHVATDDPHASVEANYYQKAVTWDSTMAQARRNDSLQWQLVASMGAVHGTESVPFAITLRDSTGAEVTGATVTIEAAQMAHADEIIHDTMQDAASGYTAQLPVHRAGLWEFRLVATRGADRFTSELRLDASTTGNAVLVKARPGDAPLASAVISHPTRS